MGVGPNLSVGVGVRVGVLSLLEWLGGGLGHDCRQGLRSGLGNCYLEDLLLLKCIGGEGVGPHLSAKLTEGVEILMGAWLWWGEVHQQLSVR